jgi:RNA polymerase sigma-70 factor (ECF subfamily)
MRQVTHSIPPERDDQLLRRYHGGDREALEELFRRYRETAYRVSYRLLGNSEDALDAVQEGFIKALTHLRGFEQRSSFKTWLLRIVSNAALDLGRQRRRRDDLALAFEEQLQRPEEQTFFTSDPLRDVVEGDLREAIGAALQEIPEAQRRTFVLHVDGGLSYREVSETLGISIGTVMSRLFYARQKLRTLLASRMDV